MTELREFLGALRWRGVVLGVAGLAAFVALCFVPMGSCSMSVRTSTPTTTTLPSRRHTVSIPPIEDSPVWVWDDETGEFVCVPGGDDPSVCDGRTWDEDRP